MNLPLPIVQNEPIRPKFALGPRDLAAVTLLRISVTDRCNLRCSYCMPVDGVAFDDHQDHLTASQITRLATAAKAAGITHYKITGGEPTVRRDLLNIIRSIANLNVTDLSMTTNGLRLSSLANDLRDAGLNRLTISWDSMQPDRIADITGSAVMAKRANQLRSATQVGEQLLSQIHQGIEAAQSAGFEKLKFNVVVMRGINDDEVVNFARLTLDNPWTIRFIEYMPLGDSQLIDESQERQVDNEDVMQRIAQVLGPLQPVDRNTEAGVGPAKLYRLPDSLGRLGFISAMSKPFCESCNRLRLTARGELRACLFDGGEVDVLPLLNDSHTTDEQLINMMRQCTSLKPETHSTRGNRAMSQLGG